MRLSRLQWLCLATGLLVCLASPLRATLEARMLTQMFVLFPLLVLGGWATAALLRWPGAWAGWLTRCDAHGLAGGMATSVVAAVWMIPVALDASLLSHPASALKLASWWLVGMLVNASWQRASSAVRIFFLGSLGSMAATAGLLYQDNEQRLCVSYLLNDQLWTGRALIALALATAVALCRVAVNADRPPP